MNIHSTRAVLLLWGRYKREGWDPGLGYYHRGTLGRVIDEAEGAGQVGAELPEQVPEDVKVVDRAVGLIPDTYHTAIVLTYHKRLSGRKAAKKLKTSHHQFYRILQYAEQRVAGYLEANLIEINA